MKPDPYVDPDITPIPMPEVVAAIMAVPAGELPPAFVEQLAADFEARTLDKPQPEALAIVQGMIRGLIDHIDPTRVQALNRALTAYPAFINTLRRVRGLPPAV